MSGKGSARRPGIVPPGAWDAIFTKPATTCPVCSPEICGCMPTEDGPGQDEACNCASCKSGALHDSDCAVHNMPTTPNGPCDCSKTNEVKTNYERRNFEGDL